MTPGMTLNPFHHAPRGYESLHRVWEQLADQLAWTHGHSRTAFILLGLDHKTNLDLEHWRQFGSPKP